jgi:hypothetical protein
MKKPVNTTQSAAEHVAIQALGFLAEDVDRLGRFLALSGVDPATIRSAARDPGFLAGVLDHLAGDEVLLMAFAGQTGLDPSTVGNARKALGSDWERDTP